ncbi:MAG: EF-hand domain-containing protein [Verrucomicrobiaceae bacterium]
MKIITTLCILALSTAASVQAGNKKKDADGAGKATPDAAFKKLDKDGSGDVSLEEFKAGKKDAAKAEEAFKKLDKDGNGKLTLEEFSAHHKK